MSPDRLKAFSDGVVAIIITIMVLELKVRHGADWSDLAGLTPVFLSYILSFVYVAIYWNNHHHLLHTSKKGDSAILWANMNLLFWLSLIPFATGWMGENHFAPLPTALYGMALLMYPLPFGNSPTKRDLFAAMALQGIMTRLTGGTFNADAAAVREAIEVADKLASALDKAPGGAGAHG